MADRPILFSGPMVRALLADTKTQTRRVFKGIEDNGDRGFHVFGAGGGIFGVTEAEVPSYAVNCLRIAAGDRLYVREAWQSDVAFSMTKPSLIPVGERIFYRVGGSINTTEMSVCAVGWRPGIHMPRWASRLMLTITDVRVERLQDITNEDCIAEGVPVHPNTHAPRTGPAIDDFARQHGLISHYGAEYMRIWNAVNGKGSWEANPWVAAYSFTVERGNIDQLASRA